MRKFLLVTGAAVCVLATPVFAKTGPFQAEGQSVQSKAVGSSSAQTARNSLIVLAANDKDDKNKVVASNDKDKDKDNKKNKDKCDEISPSHPCKGNNGFGNGGDDGSPNGKEDRDR